jgi:adenine deaminase
MEIINSKLQDIRKVAKDLGSHLPDIHITLAVFPTPAIPFLRICESGLFNLRQNKFVDLIVG